MLAFTQYLLRKPIIKCQERRKTKHAANNESKQNAIKELKEEMEK
jgi:hypothetical protein